LAEYKNPNQQGGSGMDARSMLFMVVIFLVVFFGLRYLTPKPDTNQQQTTQSSQQTAPPAAASSVASPTAAAPAANAKATVASTETQTVIENDLYRIQFTNRGAQVTSWLLKKYKDAQGQPLDMIHPDTAAKLGYPLSLYTYDAGLTAKLSQPLYIASASGTLNAPATLSFKYADGNGLEVEKTFTFDQSYIIHADTLVTQNGAPVRALLNWPVGPNALNKARGNAFGSGGATEQLDTMQSSKETHVAAAKVSGGNTLSGPFDWAGVSDIYFGTVFMPDDPQTATLVSIVNPVDIAITDKKTVPMPIIGAALGDVSGHTQTRLYVGPKVLDLLKTIHATGSNGANGPSLEKLIDFGFFGPIAKFLFLSLYFVYQHIISNWGWAIIVLTIIINLVLLPVRVSTMKSALKMQRIQPQMDQIKAKYAKYKVTDPKRGDMNAEIMKLQKDNGVNMFGGCIPNLMQLPLLLAFYTMLPKVTELHLQRWLWMPDLTGPDPLHILAVIIVVSSFLVSFYMPSPGVDPQQQKMMAFMMPAFSGYIAWNYASSFSLYWITGNLVMIVQQLVMNRTSLGREMRDIAAKRARRKAGTGVIQGKR
jgi:YidC/Oxa1 family membrane protein insertase